MKKMLPLSLLALLILSTTVQAGSIGFNFGFGNNHSRNHYYTPPIHQHHNHYYRHPYHRGYDPYYGRRQCEPRSRFNGFWFGW